MSNPKAAEATAAVVNTNPHALTVKELEQYQQNGYKAEDIASMEDIAVAVRESNKAAALAIIETGGLLAAARDQTPHGNFTFFVLDRCGLSDTTARRFMAAFRAVQKYPKLLEVAPKINLMALYSIGSRNTDLPDEAVEEIVYTAKEGELDEDYARDIINKHSPKAEKAPKAAKLGFEMIDPTIAAQAVKQMVGITDQLYGSVARSGADPRIIQKNKAFKDFAQRIAKGEGDGDAERSLTGMLYAAFVLTTSASTSDKKDAKTVEA